MLLPGTRPAPRVHRRCSAARSATSSAASPARRGARPGRGHPRAGRGPGGDRPPAPAGAPAARGVRCGEDVEPPRREPSRRAGAGERADGAGAAARRQGRRRAADHHGPALPPRRPAAGAHPADARRRGRRAARRDGRHRPGPPAGCWSSPSRATATCGSPSSPSWPRCCCRTSRAFADEHRDGRAQGRRAVRAVRWTRRRSSCRTGGGLGSPRLLGRSTRFRRADGPYPVHPAVPLLGRWLTYFAERAEQPGSCAAARGDRGARRALGDRAERPGGRQPGRAARLDRPAGGHDRAPRRPRSAEDPLLWPPAGPATDPALRQRGARPRRSAPTSEAPTEPRRASRDRPRRCATQLRADLAADVAGGRPAARRCPRARACEDRWEGDRGVVHRLRRPARRGRRRRSRAGTARSPPPRGWPRWSARRPATTRSAPATTRW